MDELRRQVAALHLELPRNGLVAWTAGNLSALVVARDTAKHRLGLGPYDRARIAVSDQAHSSIVNTLRAMSADPVDPDELKDSKRNAPLTRPRPGHADLPGMLKYGFTDARPVLERASARETPGWVSRSSWLSSVTVTPSATCWNQRSTSVSIP